LTISEAELAYEFRSRLSHGDAFLFAMPEADIRLYDKLETTLRLTILKAFREPDFASVERRGREGQSSAVVGKRRFFRPPCRPSSLRRSG